MKDVKAMRTVREKTLTYFCQEVEGDYNFDVRPVCTVGFANRFGEAATALVQNCLSTIKATYENPDRLQVFAYDGVKFYCVADFERGHTADEYEGVPYLYVIFMLPNEY